jgi:hypothetical protein
VNRYYLLITIFKEVLIMIEKTIRVEVKDLWTDATITGCIQYLANGNGTYWIWDNENLNSLTPEFKKDITGFNFGEFLKDFDEDDSHIVLRTVKDFIVTVNPNPDFCDTLCRESLAVLEGDIPCNRRISIGDAIADIIDNQAICSRINHNTICCDMAGGMGYWKVCLGDVELTDAFCRSMERFFR